MLCCVFAAASIFITIVVTRQMFELYECQIVSKRINYKNISHFGNEKEMTKKTSLTE